MSLGLWIIIIPTALLRQITHSNAHKLFIFY